MTAQLQMIVSVEFVGNDSVPQHCGIAKATGLSMEPVSTILASLSKIAKEIQWRLQQELTQSQNDQAGQRGR
ncbi:hypothetical protein [Rhizobium sp. BR 314]|uniref:hypothetical protein n=1 Tax=Rhizobium sp. BR 314 TaxID=3040013 RepID=UPI0039BED02E